MAQSLLSVGQRRVLVVVLVALGFSIATEGAPRHPDCNAFLGAVAVDPADDLVRLVYADYLEERDDSQAHFLRAQIELARLLGDLSLRWEREAQQLDLEATLLERAHRHVWEGVPESRSYRLLYRRGLSYQLQWDRDQRPGPELATFVLHREPSLEAIRFNQEAGAAHVSDIPLAIRDLEFRSVPDDGAYRRPLTPPAPTQAELWTALIDSRLNLRSLSMAGPRIEGTALATHLVPGGRFATLEELMLYHVRDEALFRLRVPNETLRVLRVEGPTSLLFPREVLGTHFPFRKLRELSLGNVAPGSVSLLPAMATAKTLDTLELTRRYNGSVVLRDLGDLAAFPLLSRLALHTAHDSASLLARLARTEGGAKLTHFVLQCDDAPSRSFRWRNARDMAELRALWIHSFPQGWADTIAYSFAYHGVPPKLRSLSFVDSLSDSGLEALVEAPLDGLVSLSLGAGTMSDKRFRTLIAAPWMRTVHTLDVALRRIDDPLTGLPASWGYLERVNVPESVRRIRDGARTFVRTTGAWQALGL